MLKYKIMYIAVLAAAAIVFLCSNTPQALILLILMAVFPLLVKLSSMENARKIRIRCDMSAACMAGADNNPIIMRVENKSRLPMGSIEAEIVYENRMFSEKTTERVTLFGRAEQSVFHIPSKADKCGRGTVTIQNVCCCDALKLTKSKIDFKWKKEFTAYPRIPHVQAETEKLLAADFAGKAYDLHRRGNDNSEVFQVREYVEGDSMSAVHWKLSGKSGDIIVREWSRPRNFRILLLCDAALKDIRGNEISPRVNSVVFGAAASLSESLAHGGIGHQFGIIVKGVPMEREIVSEGDSESALDDMMSTVIPETNNETIDDFIALGYQEKYSKLVYIAPEGNAEAAAALAPYIDTTIISVGKGGAAADVGCTIYGICADTAMEDTHYIMV